MSQLPGETRINVPSGWAEVPINDQAFLNAYRSIVPTDWNVETSLDQRYIGLVVIEVGDGLDTFLRRVAQWREAYRNEMAVVFPTNRRFDERLNTPC